VKPQPLPKSENHNDAHESDQRQELAAINELRHRRISSIINASVEEEYEDAKKTQMIGYMARCLVQATLPHSDPKTSSFERTNGLVTLSIVGRKSIGVPYGSVPRTLMAWICTEIVRTGERELMLGRSQSEFLSKLQMENDGRYIASLRKQAHKLFSSMISVTGERPDSDLGLENVVIAKRAMLFWNPRKPDERSLWESTLTVTQDFHEEVLDGPVPVNLGHLHMLRQSPMAMDIYTWLPYRMFLMHRANRPKVQIPWHALQAQFGSGFGLKQARRGAELTDAQHREREDQALRDFRKQFLRRLKEALMFYPEAREAIDHDTSCLTVKRVALAIPQTKPFKLATK